MSEEYTAKLEETLKMIESPKLPTVQDLASLLNERGLTHGDYQHTAYIAQQLKGIIRDTQNRSTGLEYDMQESLDVICTKIARIISGDPKAKDHWKDIAGYAELIARRL